MVIRTVLLDLDGVVRHFDPEHLTHVERRHGLPTGTIRDAAFDPEVLEQVITGQISRATWVELVGLAIDSEAAAAEWAAERGRIDWEVVAMVDRLRAAGFGVSILTNGTDTIAQEMEHFGLSDRFDATFSTADIGFAKPDRRAFEHVCRALDVEPRTVFFTDDSPSKLSGAVELGMTARPYEGIEVFRVHLAELVPGFR